MRDCYSAAPETEGIGICQAGKSFCGVSGQWLADCFGETTPATEIYNNDIDEDCDGVKASATQALVSRKLLTRYYLDGEPDAPLTPLMDSAPEGTPVDLDIVAGMTVRAAEVDGHRGLSWAMPSSDGRGVLSVGTTKVVDQLQGAKQLTLEVVLSIASGSVSGASAITYLGTGGDFGQLDLRFLPPQNLRFYWNNQLAASWEPLVHERCVLHVVVDLDAVPADRIKLYRNGAHVSASTNGSPTVPDSDSTLILPNNQLYAIGNRGSGARSFQGLLYYSALYATNLSPEEVALNASLLLLDDDGPPP
ncbi:LamG-like jellyroll fold domain-containing protein [Chondromyces crocatus]|uniref:LamG-like jellyroll fold domain-containing protein n=1 Tax=Chondromyces crocatus TaxID=52 RepID=UPI00067C95D3|nr:LamG-like jellyroll fold domain-containing protein [Chondromyces crocatus]